VREAPLDSRCHPSSYANARFSLRPYPDGCGHFVWRVWGVLQYAVPVGCLPECAKLSPRWTPSVEIDGRRALDHTLEAVRRHLRRTPARRTVVLAGNDPMALGAIRAFEECGPAVRGDLRNGGTSAWFYGQRVGLASCRCPRCFQWIFGDRKYGIRSTIY
jgi:hypothetical protein